MYFTLSHIVANVHLPIFHDTSCRQRYHASTVLCHCILTLANDKPTGHVITKKCTCIHLCAPKSLQGSLCTNQKQSLEMNSAGYPWISHTLWEMDSSWMLYPIRSSRVVRSFIAGATEMLIRWLQIHVQWAKPASHFINQVASVSCQ